MAEEGKNKNITGYDLVIGDEMIDMRDRLQRFLLPASLSLFLYRPLRLSHVSVAFSLSLSLSLSRCRSVFC